MFLLIDCCLTGYYSFKYFNLRKNFPVNDEAGVGYDVLPGYYSQRVTEIQVGDFSSTSLQYKGKMRRKMENISKSWLI